MDAAKLNQLKLFVDQLKTNPSILADPSLSFFRQYLESLGATLPSSAYTTGDSPRGRSAKGPVVDDSDEDILDADADEAPSKGDGGAAQDQGYESDEIIESDIEIEGDVVEPDNDPSQPMGDPSIEVTEESRDASQAAKGQAMEAISEGNLEEAIEHLTKAISLNPASAIMYATRASVYVKMKKPNAAIRDANAALEINTRSQTKGAMNGIPNSGKNDETETQLVSRQRKSKVEQRSALIDITNDSPITGLAVGFMETPLSQAKKRVQPKMTPGSGEILLRGQVKTLLQKVEEEAELVKLSSEHRSFVNLRDFLRSPSGLVAPTPNNTPNVPNLANNIGVEASVSGVNGLISVTPSDPEPEILQDSTGFNESEKNLITRSLLLDFSEKSEITDSSSPCSSGLTSQETEKSAEEDDASVWSIQVNASSIEDEDEDDEIAEEDYYDEEEEEEEEGDYEEYEGGDLLDELCEGLGKISVQEKKLPAFAGKHTRFVYNSDDEFVGEEVIVDKQCALSPSVLRLKGMPTPVGKHIRFNEAEEDEV